MSHLTLITSGIVLVGVGAAVAYYCVGKGQWLPGEPFSGAWTRRSGLFTVVGIALTFLIVMLFRLFR